MSYVLMPTMPSPRLLRTLSGRACSLGCLDAVARPSEPWEPAVALCAGCGERICVHQADYCEDCRNRDLTRRMGRFQPWRRKP